MPEAVYFPENKLSMNATVPIVSTIQTAQNLQKYYAMQVIGVDQALTSWDIRIEASLDGINFSQVLKHDTTSGDKVVIFSSSNPQLSQKWRINLVSITLGLATSVNVFAVSSA